MKAKFFVIAVLCLCVLGASVANAAMLCCVGKSSADATPPCHKTLDDSAKSKSTDSHSICKSMTCFKAQALSALPEIKASITVYEPLQGFVHDKFSNSIAEQSFQPPKHIS